MKGRRRLRFGQQHKELFELIEDDGQSVRLTAEMSAGTAQELVQES